MIESSLIQRALVAALGQKMVSPPPPPRDLPTTAEQRARYAGTYNLALAPGRTLELRIFERDGKLMSQATGQDQFGLLYQGNDTFAPTFDPQTRLTFAPSSPSPRVTLMQGGENIVGERIR